ncbi:hypothetical protein LLG96_01310 [bacterium]|nr:hypothetical protein [bacterium]
MKIVRCPKFEKRITDDEFRNLIDDLDIMSKEADELSRRAKRLIKTALERHDFIPDDRTGKQSDDDEMDSDNDDPGSEK